jgi:tetratricopeptide (TPR) repeat protein
MKNIDKYLFQALDNYPYWLEGTSEALDYALSYDEKNTTALCLYARIEAEQLQNYEAAKSYFQEALAINMDAVAVYPYYLETLLLNEDYEEAAKLIDFALTIKGINKMAILLKKVHLLERQQNIKGAIKLMKEVKLASFANDTYEIDEVEKRLKAKKDLLKPKNKSKKKKSEKKKSENKGKKK